MDADGELSQQDEAALYAHYGIPYSESRSDSGLPQGGAGRDISGLGTDGAMTRSEEELLVGTARHEAGRARLHKYVVAEQVTRTVPVRREEIRVEREPITDVNRDSAMAGGDITEEEHEVVLHEEEIVVDKQAVPKERVRIDKDVVTDEQQVSETVRKEQIETEGVPPSPSAHRREVAGRDGRPPSLPPHELHLPRNGEPTWQRLGRPIEIALAIKGRTPPVAAAAVGPASVEDGSCLCSGSSPCSCWPCC